jgi:hypothetical protein
MGLGDIDARPIIDLYTSFHFGNTQSSIRTVVSIESLWLEKVKYDHFRFIDDLFHGNKSKSTDILFLFDFGLYLDLRRHL